MVLCLTKNSIINFDEHIDSIYQKYPADIVLLHAGHNYFESDKPIAVIIAAQESIIREIRAINPGVKILVAQVIHSGKLPKYAYIPELNKRIAKMVKSQNSDNVLLVNQTKHFDWQKHTISDRRLSIFLAVAGLWGHLFSSNT